MGRILNTTFAILTIGPILLSFACIAIVIGLSSFADCRIDESGVHPCWVFGTDVGEVTAVIGLFAAWGPLIFGPFVVGAGILWVLVAGVRAILHRKR